MKTKFVERLPQEQGTGLLTSYPAIKTPWGKMFDWHFAVKYLARDAHVVSAAMLGALRILIPDYVERATLMCEANYQDGLNYTAGQNGLSILESHNIHPFACGGFMGCLIGDIGDESLLMTGRVNDFGTYRVEKELDTCPWDICGSEICRCTTVGFNGQVDGIGKLQRPGPRLELNMVEALGCGDLHCRIIGESREKYPMPEKPIWESFGPIATEDLVKYTPEELQEQESAMFRNEANNEYVTGTNVSVNWGYNMYVMFATAGELHIHHTLVEGIKRGLFTEEQVDYALKSVCEAAGKAAFGAFYAKDGLRSLLGVPLEMNSEDARILGGLVELFLQSKLVPYEVEKFEGEETVYIFDRAKIPAPKFLLSLIAYWCGASKTLLSAKWALWEEDSPEGKVRLKIARKIDKFC
ncbi:hypothetical protein [Clostridium thailandense]|uniref:hypothetical protein n=1 Tax=Clostridium thailandense TaxID=2794346 RepID=UPI003989FC61